MSYRCRPCGAPLTGAAKCEYCGCLTHAASTTPGEIISFRPNDEMRRCAEMQRAAMMRNQSGLQQRGMLFGGATSGVLGGLFR